MPDVSGAIDMFSEGLTYVDVSQVTVEDDEGFFPKKVHTSYKVTGVIRNVITSMVDPLNNTEIVFDSEVHINKKDMKGVIPSSEDIIITSNNYRYVIKQIREISNYYKFSCKRVVGGEN